MINKVKSTHSAPVDCNLDEVEAHDFAPTSNIGSKQGAFKAQTHRQNKTLKPSQASLLEATATATASSPDLGRLMQFATSDHSIPAWEPTDLKAILTHQLSAPMVFDFCATIKSWVSAEESRTWVGHNGAMPKSFQDLFTHVSPSTKLLKLTKEFAKANWSHPDSPIPSEVAVVLYYTCIAVAFLRHGEWISELTRVDAQIGFEWVQSQSWVDEATKTICKEVVLRLN